MPVDGNACQVQQHHAFAGTQAVVNGSAPVGDLLRLGAAAAQGQGIHAVQQANPAVQQAVQQVQANSQAQYQIQYMGGVPVLTQVVPDQQQQQQRRQNLIQTAQMMTTLQQLQFAQAQQLAQTQTARTQQQQVAQTQAQAAQAQAAQAQQLAQAAQLQKAQQQTAQQAQQQATASAAQSQYAPSNQTLQPQVQAQNQFVQQNPQLINNGTATASPVSHAVDQSLNAVVSQQPQAATIPASAQVGRNQVDISSHFSRCLNSLIRPAILPLASATAASAPVAVAAGSDCPIGSRRRWSQRPIIGNQPDADPSSTATKPSAKRNGIPPASSRHSGHPGPGFQPTSGARNQCNSTKGPSECPSSFAAALPRPTRRIEKRE